LGYLIGYEKLFETLQAYYAEWKFKHPLPNDFRRIAERISGIQLQWYLTDWTQTTNKIDYAITNVEGLDNKTLIEIERKELMPMPLEILILLKNGQSELHYVPISLMRGEKKNPYPMNWTVHPDWSWAHLNYSLEVDLSKEDIETIIIDPSSLMADIDKSNNYYVAKEK
jgi:hypothetical protein